MQGALFYLFVRNVLYGRTFQGWDWIFLVPPLVQLIDLIPLYLLSSDEKLHIIQELVADFANNHHVADGMFFSMRFSGLFRFVYNFAIVLLTLTTIYRFKKNTENEPIPTAQVRWVILLTVTLVLFALAVLSGPPGILVQTLIQSRSVDLQAYTRLMNLSLFFNSLGAMLISMLVLYRQEVLFAPPPRIRSSSPSDILSSSSMTKEELLELAERIDQYVTEQMVFRRKGIKITVLSTEMSIPTNKISQALYFRHNVNFSQYLNEKRVTYAKGLLLQGEHLNVTMQAIGEEAGFSSRSNFYSVFQSMTGVTPNEFASQARESGQKELSS